VHDLPRGTVTFLFTDVQASTDLTRSLGEAYSGVLSDSRRLLREAVAPHGGVEVDTQGDGLFVVFDTARDAVLGAAFAQRAISAHEWPEDVELRVRMGLHTAEPHVWEEGYTGVGLTRVARICAAGHGGQVLLSRTTAGIVADDAFDGLGLRALGRHRLKGLVWPEEIFQLVIDGLSAEFPPLDTPEGAGPATETGTVLTTDVEGLTNLSKTLQPDDFRALIAQYHVLAEAVWTEFDGLGVIAVGDTSLAVFRSPKGALRAATELQKALLSHPWPGDIELRVRVALDSGEVLATSHGYFGHAVNRCFMLCATAQGGQTLVSEVTRGLLGDGNLGEVDLAPLGERELGGSAVRVYEIVAGAPKA
jgi:class 3 adenylate cyclase